MPQLVFMKVYNPRQDRTAVSTSVIFASVSTPTGSAVNRLGFRERTWKQRNTVSSGNQSFWLTLAPHVSTTTVTTSGKALISLIENTKTGFYPACSCLFGQAEQQDWMT
jgi:hypothetical protein